MAIVETQQGALKGILTNENEVTYYSFKGIPYAKPPLGLLRFKAPEPPETWTGVRDASQHGPICPQYNERLDRIEAGSEDCLYLNVYSKSLTPSNPLPVMVWIHGGSFYTGSGNSEFYGPQFFMAHDVILVTFNYRLEVLGFLCLDIDEAPGNAGLKDQVAALKWVKNNISAFGGDPNNITIFGCSAGSASTSYHLMSKKSQGLFNKAICQSGVCLNEWSYNIYARERAFQLGKLLGCNTEDPRELLEFLRKVASESLVNIKLPPLLHERFDIADTILFGPVIENKNLNGEKFITDPPPDLVRNGHMARVPIVVGYASGEGIEISRNLPHLIGQMCRTGFLVPRELKLRLSIEDLQKIDEKIRTHYFKDQVITDEMFQEVTNFETDRLFVYNIMRLARYHIKHTSMPVFVYKFNIESERNFYKTKYKMEAVKGVCHADDLPYFFNVSDLDIPLTDDSRLIIKQIVQLWVNFASTGNPTAKNTQVEWKPYTDKERHCFIIDRQFQCLVNVDRRNMEFWENIYNETNLDIEQNGYP